MLFCYRLEIMEDVLELKLNHRPIFLFDGYCNLCNGAVDFILKNEKSAEILFCSLQSEAAQKLLKKFEIDASQLHSSYFILKGELFEKATGSIKIASFLKKPWSILGFFGFLPIGFLNLGYDFIAKNRYRFFGKKETCRIATQSEKSRFLE